MSGAHVCVVCLVYDDAVIITIIQLTAGRLAFGAARHGTVAENNNNNNNNKKGKQLMCFFFFFLSSLQMNIPLICCTQKVNALFEILWPKNLSGGGFGGGWPEGGNFT